MTSAATKQLVLFLTRPLMRIYPQAKLVALKLCLHTALAPSTLGVAMTLYLSASRPPPPALQRACALAGVRWADWIQLLSGGVDLRVFVHDTALAVQVGTQPRRRLWAAAPAVTPFEARGRCSLGAAALHPTRVPTLLSIAFAPPCAAADEPSADDDSASDTESDAGSDASDCTSASASSASTAATSVCSAAPAPAPTPSCPEPPRAAPPPPPTRYLYQGGVTTVASGRVLLGVARAPDSMSPPPAPRRPSSAPPALTARKPGETWRSSAVARTQTDSRSGWRKAGTADSWRRPAQAAIAI